MMETTCCILNLLAYSIFCTCFMLLALLIKCNMLFPSSSDIYSTNRSLIEPNSFSKLQIFFLNSNMKYGLTEVETRVCKRGCLKRDQLQMKYSYAGSGAFQSVCLFLKGSTILCFVNVVVYLKL